MNKSENKTFVNVKNEYTTAELFDALKKSIGYKKQYHKNLKDFYAESNAPTPENFEELRNKYFFKNKFNSKLIIESKISDAEKGYLISKMPTVLQGMLSKNLFFEANPQFTRVNPEDVEYAYDYIENNVKYKITSTLELNNWLREDKILNVWNPQNETFSSVIRVKILIKIDEILSEENAELLSVWQSPEQSHQTKNIKRYILTKSNVK